LHQTLSIGIEDATLVHWLLEKLMNAVQVLMNVFNCFETTPLLKF